jgi:hypothetical protein
VFALIREVVSAKAGSQRFGLSEQPREVGGKETATAGQAGLSRPQRLCPASKEELSEETDMAGVLETRSGAVWGSQKKQERLWGTLFSHLLEMAVVGLP